MHKKSIKWGILGTSYISEVMAKAIHESQTGDLTAIASRSQTTANQFAEKFSIRKTYTDYQRMLEDDEVDVIYIGLPNHLHKEWIIRSAQAGKHVLCEKPFVISIAEAREVIDVVEKANVFCLEALMYRCHPFIKKLQEIMQSKVLGEIRLYNAVYTAHISDVANPTAGGSIRNLGCYPISLVRLLAGSEPIDIQGKGRLNKNNNDNQASVLLQFADKSIAMVSTADDLKMVWQFEVYGTNGYLKVITNPWLPGTDNNKLIITLHNEPKPIEINITAENSLYTYQIDFTNNQILENKTRKFDEKLLLDSLHNTIALETWLDQVKALN